MMNSIGHLAKITSGIYVKAQSQPDVYYLQARDFDQNHRVLDNLEPQLMSTSSIEKHYLMDGDVLLVAKGFYHFAVTYRLEVAPAVASSIFLVLQEIDTSSVIPEYLTLFLNHSRTQRFLTRQAKGTSLPSIRKKTIADIRIDLPSLEVQQKILKIDSMRKKEAGLVQEIEKLKDFLLMEQLFTLNREHENTR